VVGGPYSFTAIMKTDCCELSIMIVMCMKVHGFNVTQKNFGPNQGLVHMPKMVQTAYRKHPPPVASMILHPPP
jgi:hypothetical protein